MPAIDVNIEVYCAECGEGLCNQTEATHTRHRNEPCFRVQPCKKCLAESRSEGRQEGIEEMESKVDDLKIELENAEATIGERIAEIAQLRDYA